MYLLVLGCLVFSSCSHIILGLEHDLSDEELDSFEVTIHPEAQKVMEGSPVVFTCISSIVHDDIQFQWRKGYKIVNPEEDGLLVRQISGHVSVLRIEKADITKHKKTFTCEASIPEAGVTARAEAPLKIFRKGRARKNYPSVIAHTQSPVMVDQSDSKLTITCTSNIEPFSREAPNWRWIKNNTFDLRLSHNEETARIDMSEAGTLEISDVRWSDSGTYECVAENRRGSSYSRPIVVQVEEKEACRDHTGRAVPNGEMYQPTRDPCMECVCMDGRQGFCAMVGCEAPPCRDYHIIDGTCCEFRCHDEVSNSEKEPCTDRTGKKVPHGNLYQPSPDPCMECECVDGDKQFCTMIMCDEPPCRDYDLIEGTCCGFRCHDKDLTIDIRTEVGVGTCMQYLGPSCREFIQGRNIFMKPGHNQDSLERKLNMLFTGAESLSENCMETILPFLCFHTVPLCDESAVVPRGRHVCREDCEMVANICQDEYFVFRDQRINGTLVLPQCSELPSKNFAESHCISFEDYIDVDASKEEDIEDRDKDDRFTRAPCRDRLGKIVLDGTLFLPEEDPCVACTCSNGQREGCMTVSCEPPPCENYVRPRDSCCGYTCIEGPTVDTITERCLTNNGSYIYDGEYHPGSDLCTTCRCVRGRKEACMSVGCIPPDCPNPQRVPGVCCEFICPDPNTGLIRNRTSTDDSERCIANNGSYVYDGDYHPGSDLCTTCRCVRGRKEACMSVGCVPPDCPNPEPVPGVCCEFTCPGSDKATSLDSKERCIANNGSYIYDGEYHPGTDLCTTCICVRGRKEACMSVGCQMPDCPNAEPIPGTCCEFTCPSSDMVYELYKTSFGKPKAPGSLSVQKVGPRSAIIQWKFDRPMRFSMLTLVYTSMTNRSLTNITLPIDKSYVVLGDLDLNNEYEMMLIANQKILFDVADFTLDGRAGRTLNLGDVEHGNVYESRGHNTGFSQFFEIPDRDDVHIMMDSFHRVDLKRDTTCRNSGGCGVMQFSMYGIDGRLSPVVAFMFDDERDFNWAKAHL